MFCSKTAFMTACKVERSNFYLIMPEKTKKKVRPNCRGLKKIEAKRVGKFFPFGVKKHKKFRLKSRKDSHYFYIRRQHKMMMMINPKILEPCSQSKKRRRHKKSFRVRNRLCIASKAMAVSSLHGFARRSGHRIVHRRRAAQFLKRKKALQKSVAFFSSSSNSFPASIWWCLQDP